MFKTTSSKLIFFLLLSLFILFFLLSYFSEGTFDAGDGICHYSFSRYSWQHPYLFLNSWAKPFFTLLSSPFSQFGLLGLNVFNILCALVSSFVCYKLIKLTELDYPFIVIIFLCFAPVYFPTMNSGLTEPFFGLVLITSIYLIYEQEFFWGILLVSFLPFVRSEGFLILPLFAIVLIIMRRHRSIPLLGFGTIIYSFIGSFYYKDLFWIINKNPYNGNIGDVYGHGELLHFVKSYYYIWGYTLALLFVISVIFICISVVDMLTNKDIEMEDKIGCYTDAILIYGSFLVYFVAHSIFWWKGMAGSLGLLRVIAGVMPCSAIICFYGLDSILAPIQNKIIQYIIVAIVLISVIASPFQHDYFPYKPDTEQALVKQAGDWFKTSPYKNKVIYYAYPYLTYELNADNFDSVMVRELGVLYSTIKAKGINAIPDSSVIFWDGHFGPNECRLPLNKLMNDPNFNLIKSFVPETNVTTLNNKSFAVYVFTKLHTPLLKNILKDSLYFNLDEKNAAIENTGTFSSEYYFSGNTSSKIESNTEFSATINLHPLEIKNYEGVRSFIFNAKVFSLTNDSVHTKVVASVIKADGTPIFWQGNPISFKTKENKWQTISTQFDFIPAQFSKTDILRIYIWNYNKQKFYTDDFSLKFLGIE